MMALANPAQEIRDLIFQGSSITAIKTKIKVLKQALTKIVSDKS